MHITFDPRNAEETVDTITMLIRADEGLLLCLMDEFQETVDRYMTARGITTAAVAEDSVTIPYASNIAVTQSAPPVIETVGPETGEVTTQAQAPTIDPVAGVELDANGTPWTKTLHAGTKTQTKDGVWKAKRGIDKDVLAEGERAERDKIAGTPEPVIPEQPVLPLEMPAASIVTMEDVNEAYTLATSSSVVTPQAMGPIYRELEIDPSQLTVNETMRARLVEHLKGLMA